MANKTPVPLLGRLAVQLKLVNPDQLKSALQNATGSGASLAEVMLEMGLVNAPQLKKLEQVQRDVIAKHRAKKAAAAGAGPSPPAAESPQPEVVHDTAARAAQDASPMTGGDVLELGESPAPGAPALELDTPAGSGGPSLELDTPAGSDGPSLELDTPAASDGPSLELDQQGNAPPALDLASQGDASPSLELDTQGNAPGAIDLDASGDASAPLELAGPGETAGGSEPDPILELADPTMPAPSTDAPPAAPAAPAAPPAAAPAAQGSMHLPALDDENADDPGLELGLPQADDAARQQLTSLLQAAVQAGASDVHFHSQGPVLWRVGGELVKPDVPMLEQAHCEALVSAALTPDERRVAMRDGEIDYCLELPGIGRFRANSYRQQRGFDSTYRVVSARPPTLEELGLPEDLKKLTTYHQGMVLITGPAGCGKSATMAALVNLINEEREEHILCIEDPIEILHPSKKCLVNQRHAGRHTESFARALRGALREDPDVIVIGELRDLETISLAMTAAETGHFVLATLHTNNAVRTVNRMIGAFPASEQGQIRTMLSESLRAVISQRLVPRADGQGRVPALELLVMNKAISNLVRDEKTVQIRSSIQTGKSHGMYLLEQSLNELVEQKVITRETALRFSEDDKLITAQ